MNDEKISKFISYVLRHDPSSIEITLDSGGWVDVGVLVRALKMHRKAISRKRLLEIVETNDKSRFALSKGGRCIRASQGHSVDVDLGYQPIDPPEFLYHGTVSRSVDDIMRDGLDKKSRHHVHLSGDAETAKAVGARRGKPVILKIHAKEMHNDGFEFMLSDNGVWLVDSIPSQYIEVCY